MGRGVSGCGPAWHGEETCPRLLLRHGQGRHDEVDAGALLAGASMEQRRKAEVVAHWTTSWPRRAEAAMVQP
jgi:hypothetical protein